MAVFDFHITHQNVSDNDLLELIDDMRSVVNIITDEEGYGAAEELEDLLEDIVYEMRNEYY